MSYHSFTLGLIRRGQWCFSWHPRSRSVPLTHGFGRPVLLGVVSFVHGGLSICHSFCSFCSDRFLGLLGRSIQHKRRTLIRGAGSQAAARRGAQPRHVALAALVHERDQTFRSKCQSGFRTSLRNFGPSLGVGSPVSSRLLCLVFFHIPSSAHLGPLSGACILIASWLLVVAMSRSLSGCHYDRARLGGFLRPELASFASWFSGFPRGLGVKCFAHMFLWFCFTHCCLLVSGYEALRPANVVLLTLVPGCCKHSHQPGWHNLEDRFFLKVSHF